MKKILTGLALIAITGCVSVPVAVNREIQYLNRQTTEQKVYLDGSMEMRMERYIFQAAPVVKIKT